MEPLLQKLLPWREQASAIITNGEALQVTDSRCGICARRSRTMLHAFILGPAHSHCNSGLWRSIKVLTKQGWWSSHCYRVWATPSSYHIWHTSSCESTFNLPSLEVLWGDSKESNGRHGVLMKAPRWFSNVSPGFIRRWWFTILATTLSWSIVQIGCKLLLRQTWSFTFESMIILFHAFPLCKTLELNFGRALPAGLLYYLIFLLPRNKLLASCYIFPWSHWLYLSLAIFCSAVDGCLFQVAITCNRLHWMFFTDWGYDKFWQQCCRQPT